MRQLNSFFQIVTAIVVLVALTSCADHKLEPIPNGGTILAFGDSLTLGYGTDKSNSYPAVLAGLTGLNVINSGISGETTDQGLERLPQELDRTAPDLIILIEGGNDILKNRSHTAIKENLKGMIELAKNKGIPVILIGVPEKKLFSDSAPLYKDLAEIFQLVFDGELIADLQFSPSLKSDRIHFNKKGYRKMAESIYDLLEDNGALQ